MRNYVNKIFDVCLHNRKSDTNSIFRYIPCGSRIASVSK